MAQSAPRIAALATALPEHRMTQSEAKEGARIAFAGLPDLDRLLHLFDRSGVESRYMVHPRDWYLAPRSFGERNHEYIRAATDLGGRAVSAALDRAGLAPTDVDTFVFTTTTGLATPSVDALLAARLGMKPGLRRLPLFGLGCAGGAAGLAVASDRLRSRPGETAVVLSVELCSLTLLVEQVSKVNLVGSALFGDGAAAAVLTGAGRKTEGPAITGAATVLFPDSGHLMGWDFTERGFELVLSTQVPGFILEAFPDRALAFLAEHGLTLADVAHFALHPGGRQVLEAYRRGLGLPREATEASAAALRRVGNLSSAAVLFSLAEILERGGAKPGDRGLAAAMGPGFAAELLLLEW